jgi:hypothetical protein
MTTKNFLIYEIRFNNLDMTEFYIGHTCNLDGRLRAHKTASKNPTNPHYEYKIYKTIRENGGWDNWTAKEIYNLGDVSKLEARQKEEQLTKEMGATLNMWKAFRSKEEATTYYGKGSEWYIKNHERAKKRYATMCQKIDDLEKENVVLKEQLDDVFKALKKN